MTLYIKTDLQDFSWFTYILEEFRRINHAKFDFSVVDLNENIISDNLIYYSRNYLGRVHIVNKSDTIPKHEIKYLDDKLFIIPGTEELNNKSICNYDIFWNSFVFLSRLEEYLEEENGHKIKSYCINHPRTDKSTFNVPVVNHLFDRLEQIILENFPGFLFGEKQKPVIELSHDVDYINKTIQLRLKQTAFNGYNFFKTLNKPTVALQILKKAFISSANTILETALFQISAV